MGLFSKKKNEEVAIDELTPQIKTKLDELAQKGNQFEEEEQYEEAIQAWKEALSLIPEPQQFYSETIWFPTLNFEAFSISAILRILKLINASKTHFSINNSKSYYKIRKTFFFWFVQFHTVLEVYEPQTLV